MADDDYTEVDDYQQCADRSAVMKHERHQTFFQPISSLEFITIDILGLFLVQEPDTNLSSLLLTATRSLRGQYLWQRLQHRMPRQYCSTIGYLLVAFCRFHLSTMVRNSLAMLCEKFCLHINAKRLATSAYHTHTNGQAERYSRNLVA